MKKTTSIIIGIIVIVLLAVVWMSSNRESAGVQNSSEDIGNAIEKRDIIRVTTPSPGEVIRSPLTIKGEARGGWFFEANFPITLVDSAGIVIAQHYGTAQGDPANPDGVNWMTEEFVPFEAILTFENPISTTDKKGTLILHKNNASGLPENDENLVVPIFFE
ncbi:MAG: Gmad2 immunoglobulin-like domain-containing protein [Candidatus Paceibacterota bacterium]